MTLQRTYSQYRSYETHHRRYNDIKRNTKQRCFQPADLVVFVNEAKYIYKIPINPTDNDHDTY